MDTHTNNSHYVQPVILCGGSGTRLWPLSRTGFPKQFLSLAGSETLFQQTLKRVTSADLTKGAINPPLLVINEKHRFLALEQMREAGIAPGMFVLEPAQRNTAPAMTMAALAAMKNGQDPILVVTPSDQTIQNTKAFTRTLSQAIQQATQDHIVILGISPDRPETGYGYIKGNAQSDDLLNVESFVEKPDEETACRYLQEGSYYWNAGIFVIKASLWLKALGHFQPDIEESSLKAFKTCTASQHAGASFLHFDTSAFKDIPSLSIDYAVMEHCPGSQFSCKMVPLDAGWNDLGAWDAVWKTLTKDQAGNVHVGDILSRDSTNTFALSSSRLVSVLGVQDLVIVETPDAVLVANRAHSQNVKTIVEHLHAHGREEHKLHRKVHCPWGWYDTINQGKGFKVKRLHVNPGACLGLQKHKHRTEHWLVVQGYAEIVRGDEILHLTQNQSVDIAVEQVHQIKNPATGPLEIIETQLGEILEESDIIRLEDDDCRTTS